MRIERPAWLDDVLTPPDLSPIGQAITEQTIELTKSIDGVKDAVDTGTTTTGTKLDGIKGGLDGIGGKLDGIKDGIDRLTGPGEPGEPGGGISGPGAGSGAGQLQVPERGPAENDLPDAPEWDMVWATFQSGYADSPIGQALAGMDFSIGGGSSCPVWTVRVPWINTTLRLDVHCILLQSVAAFISAIMIFAYTWLAVRRFIR